MTEHNHQMLCEAAATAGVELGNYDNRILQWLAGYEPQTCAVFAGIISRARPTPRGGRSRSDKRRDLARRRWHRNGGSYAAARDLYQLIARAHEEAEEYGREHPDTLTARHQLAVYTGQAGDAAGARDLLTALLPVRKRVLGPQHPGHPQRPRVLDAAGKLARAYPGGPLATRQAHSGHR